MSRHWFSKDGLMVLRMFWRHRGMWLRVNHRGVALLLGRLGLMKRYWICNRDDPSKGEWLV